MGGIRHVGDGIRHVGDGIRHVGERVSHSTDRGSQAADGVWQPGDGRSHVEGGGSHAVRVEAGRCGRVGLGGGAAEAGGVVRMRAGGSPRGPGRGAGGA